MIRIAYYAEFVGDVHKVVEEGHIGYRMLHRLMYANVTVYLLTTFHTHFPK